MLDKWLIFIKICDKKNSNDKKEMDLNAALELFFSLVCHQIQQRWFHTKHSIHFSQTLPSTLTYVIWHNFSHKIHAISRTFFVISCWCFSNRHSFFFYHKLQICYHQTKFSLNSFRSGATLDIHGNEQCNRLFNACYINHEFYLK